MCPQVTELAQDAIEEAIAYSTLGISSEDGSALGTGVAIEFNGCSLIVTAKHLIEDIEPDSLWFYFRSDAPLIRVPKKDFIKHIGEVTGCQRFQIPITRILASDLIDDLSILVVGPTFVSVSNLHFHQVEDYRETPRPGTEVVVSGIAAELSQEVKNLSTGQIGYMIFKNFEWRSIREAENHDLQNFDPMRHFLIDFSGDPISDEFVTKPHSMSGCGIWMYLPFSDTDLWIPKVKLCGIQSSWYERKRLIKAIRIERLLNLLKGL